MVKDQKGKYSAENRATTRQNLNSKLGGTANCLAGFTLLLDVYKSYRDAPNAFQNIVIDEEGTSYRALEVGKVYFYMPESNYFEITSKYGDSVEYDLFTSFEWNGEKYVGSGYIKSVVSYPTGHVEYDKSKGQTRPRNPLEL